MNAFNNPKGYKSCKVLCIEKLIILVVMFHSPSYHCPQVGLEEHLEVAAGEVKSP